jgi:hypothetical protein
LCNNLLADLYISSAFLGLQLLIDKAFMNLQGINTSEFQVSLMLMLHTNSLVIPIKDQI